ncbi:MAG: S41 family peptidase [Fibrobacter sp.]|jgi:carboxyl-terminal processing protease|nr:S41 family peptidase [Fibrobacter sp.]
MKTQYSLSVSVFVFLLSLAAGFGFAFSAETKKEPADFYEELSRLNKVFSEINLRYVEAVDPAELSAAAVQGIRGILDPHTAVFDPKESESLKISTEGEFGGVGITIGLRDNVLTVVSPLAGTPAFSLGIRAGDRILKIDGKETRNLTLDEAVEKLRGKVGTNVTVSIAREGAPDLIDFTITRAKIVVHAVPYFAMLNKEIGYIKLATFSQKTSSDVEDALRKLQAQGMKKLVLDLRYNPGGLLNQAIEVAELFLKQGDVIVSTRGRTQKTESHARRNGILGKEVPLIVLVNQGSASASEIVAGAIQDWDRGLIIGKTTFGKGSVQTIFPLDNQGHALKLTTAFYYLPFGRCINKPENGIKGLAIAEKNLEDELAAEKTPEDSVKIDTAVVDTFVTAGGRKMFGAGGIAPDVDIELDPLPWVVQAQERMGMYFKFAVKIRPALEARKETVDMNWMVSDSLFTQFKDFCLKDTNFTKIKSNAAVTADFLEETLIKEQNFLGDSSKTITNPALSESMKKLRESLDVYRNVQFEESKQYIKDGIKRELLTAVAGDSVSTAFTLGSDTQLNEAIKYLSDMNLYNKAITAPKSASPAKKSSKTSSAKKKK